MGFRLGHCIFLLAALLLVLMHFLAAEEVNNGINNAAPDSVEDDSSSEEKEDDSTESRAKRSTELKESVSNGIKIPDEDVSNAPMGRAGLPALPDPATVIKIAEILQMVGEKVIPILVEGNPTADLVADRIGQNLLLLQSFKREIEKVTDERKQRV